MASIDERVVSMAFENGKFEAKAAQTLKTLGKLSDALKLTGAAKGLQDVQAAVDKMNLGNAAAGADKLKASFASAGAAAEASKGKFATFVENTKNAFSSLSEKLKLPNVASMFSGIQSAASKVNFGPLTRALDVVKTKLGFPEAPAAFQNIERSASNVQLNGIVSAINSASRGFSILSGAAAVALGGIVSRAVSAGANIVKALSLDPIMAGFQNYETQINAVQVILANTGLTGEAGMNKVNSALANLNKYANLTVYNFGQMAKNIGTFTAAGVGLSKATESIKGIANLAALSGSSAEQASSAMYQLSQAIAAGQVHLQDWNSVVNAGIGGQVFQKALFNTAKAMGTMTSSPVGQTFEQWKKAGNSFRQSLSTTAKASQDTAGIMKKAHQDAARTVADAERSAAESVASAAQQVKDAQTGVADTARQASEDIASAVQSQTDTIKKASEDVATALDGVREARKKLAEAMKPPSKDELQAAADNLKTSQLDQADLAGAVTDAQQEQKRSIEDLGTAQQNLADLQKAGSGATAAQIQAATRAVEDAQKRVRDASDAQTRALLQQRAAARGVDQAEKDLQTTREKGTKKDANVKSAQDALTQAIQNYRTTQIKAQQEIAKAHQNVADVQLKATESEKKAGQSLATAEKGQAKAIQDAQRQIGDAHRQAAEQINTARSSISSKQPKSWLTTDVLVNTLRQFTGTMSTAQLKAQGFTAEQIKAIQQMGKNALNAATKIRTISQLFQALKEEVATAWSAIFKTLFGNITQATSLFSSLHITIENALTKPIYAFNKVLQQWAKLGGRRTLLKGLQQGFEDLMAVINPIKEAFKEIFPPATAQSLVNTTNKFAALMDKLKIGPETAKNLKDTFKGFFAVLDIGWQVIKGVGIAIGQMFGAFGQGSGGILKVSGGIGNFAASLDKAIKNSKGFHDFFVNLGKILSIPIRLLGTLASLIAGVFGSTSKTDVKGTTDAFDGVGKALSPMQKVLEGVARAWDVFINVMKRVGAIVHNVVPGIVDAFSGIIGKIRDSFANANFESIFTVIQTGLIAGIFLTIKKALGGGVKVDFGGGLINNLRKSFSALTGSLQSMQQTLKAATLLEIAFAIGSLAVGIKVLSTIDPKRLASAMTAVAVGLGQLVGAMALLTKIGGKGAFIQLPFIASSLILLALAVDTLAIAVKVFSTMSWGELLKGLTGVAGVLVAVGAAVRLMPKDLILIGPALIPLAIGINILALAVKQFSSLSWGELAKGLVGVAGALVAIGVGITLIPTGQLLAAGPGLIAVSIGLTLLSIAVRSFGSMKLGEMAKGLLGIAASLVVIGLAITAIPPTVALQGAGLIVLGIGLTAIATAMALMGSMKISTMVKGLVGLGGALLILAVGLEAMTGTLPGAAALVAAAAGLAILVPALGLLGVMKWSTILKGLAAIALSLGVIGAVGLVAGPGLIAIGIGLLGLGIGLSAVAAAVYLAAKGIALLSEDGQKGIAVLVGAITAFVALLPTMVINFVKGLVQILASVAQLAPQIATSLASIITTFLNLIVTEAPQLALAMGSLLDALILVVVTKAPKLAEAGIALMASFLQSIASHIADITVAAGNIITTFLTKITNELPNIISAGVNLLAKFLSGITDHMPKVVGAVAKTVTTFLNNVAAHIPDIIKAGTSILVAFVKGIADNVGRAIKAGDDLVIKILEGIGQHAKRIVSAATKLIGDFLDAAAGAMLNMVDRIGQIILNFLHGIRDAINKYERPIIDAGIEIGKALINGMVKGIFDWGHVLRHAIEDAMHLLPHWARKILGISSPSKVFKTIGNQVGQGIVVGLREGHVPVKKAAGSLAKAVHDGWTENFTPETLAKLNDLFDPGTLNPKITPIVDTTGIKQLDKDIANLAWFKALKASGAGFGGIDVTIASLQAEIDKLQNPDTSSTAPFDTGGGMRPTYITYEQNNYSPESLTPAEVYRQTKNQISTVKHALGIVGAVPATP